MVHIVVVVLHGNGLIFGMSLIKMVKRIGQSVGSWGTANGLEFGLDTFLYIFP